MFNDGIKTKLSVLPVLWLLALLPGCLATRSWVGDQVNPVNDRISKLEAQLGQAENRLPPIENRLTGLETRTNQAEAKADQAVSNISNLRLEKRLEVDFKDGVFYRFNSASLTDQAKKSLDIFLSDLKLNQGSQTFVVGGHADSAGPGRYNYELARKRAESVAQYLILEKKIDPMRIMTVSFGESSPSSDNTTRQGREKNRRVEIRVFSDVITTEAGMSTAQR